MAQYELSPAALRNKKLYDGKIYTTKELIDKLILHDGFVNKTIINTKNGVYRLSNDFGLHFNFSAKAQKKYIDQLLSKVNKGAKVELEHKGTIEKTKRKEIKTNTVAKLIAADHIAEKLDYYDELETAKLEKGGPIEAQDLSKGTVLEGPSHAKGGIEIQVNNKPVAEAEGGEVVINKNSSKLFCEELSELNQKGGGKALDCDEKCDTCEHKKMALGAIVPKFNNNDEIEGLTHVMKTHFKEIAFSITEVPSLFKDYENKRIFRVQFEGDATLNEVLTYFEAFRKHWFKTDKGAELIDMNYLEFSYSGIDNVWLLIIPKNIDLRLFLQNFYKVNLIDNSETFEKGGKLELPINGDEFEEEDVMAKGGKLKKETTAISTENLSDYQTNKAIEQMIDAKGIDPANYTSDEKQYLRKYSGYGGIVADEFSLEEAKRSFTEFYTPDTIVRKMWALAYKYGFKDGGNVLEPSVGTGEFLKYMPSNSMAAGYEINKYSYSICKILYPQYNFYLQPFENVFIKNRDTLKNKINDLPKYSLVIGNPPYGDVSGIGMGMGEKQYTNAKNWIEYFILRGLDLTLPGGLLIYIIGTEVANGGTPFLQQGTNKIKEKIAERADLVDAYRLPNGVFDRTDVLSDILVFKKK